MCLRLLLVILFNLIVFCQNIEFNENYFDQDNRDEIKLRRSTDDSSGFSSPIVFLSQQGRVKGGINFSKWSEKPINEFHGIKYGYVGKGVKRFQVASPPRQWFKIFDATKKPMACPSFPELDSLPPLEARNINVDDCLTLSIFTPSISEQYPVMVYIHGEFLFDGSADEASPLYLMEHDIVLVSVNYRLAPFGFMSTLTNEIPGNVALSDIQMALEWIQRNIRKFGGDPSNVTVFGTAGGATLIHALALSNKTSNIFHKMILQSGSALNPYFIDEKPLIHARDIAIKANCENVQSASDINRCLINLSTSDLIQAFLSHCQANERKGFGHFGGAQLAIGDNLGYIPKHPALMNRELSPEHRLPLIGGVAKHAGAYFISKFYDFLRDASNKTSYNYIDIVLKHIASPHDTEAWKRVAITKIFTSEQLKNGSLSQLTFGFIELCNLIMYKIPLLQSTKYNWQQRNTFLYNLEHQGTYQRYSISKKLFPFNVGASLSDENIYLFPFPDEVAYLDMMDTQLTKQITQFWTNFARSGIPDITSSYKQWPAMNHNYGSYIKLSTKLELDVHFTDGISMPDLLFDPNEENQILKNKTTTTTKPPK